MKKTRLLAYSFLLCAILITAGYKYFFPQANIEKAFAASGAAIIAGEIHVYGTKFPANTSSESLTDLIKLLSKFTGEKISKSYNLSHKFNDYINMVEMKFKNTQGYLVHIKVEEQEDRDQKGIYASVTLNWNNKMSGFENISKKISRNFEINGFIPHPSIQITGDFKGKLETSTIDKIATDVFNVVRAKKVEDMRGEKLVSVSAWSPQLNETLKVGGKNVNLNLALRYNKLEDRTYLWIGTPVIKTEY